MNDVVVVDTAVVTGLGDDLETTWRRLLGRETAVRPLERFATGQYQTHSAAWVAGLPDDGRRSRLFPLLERLVGQIGKPPAGCRLLTATTKGCIDTMERLARGLGGDPAELETRAILAWLSSRLALADRGININAACASSTLAVARAAASIAAGSSDAVLVVCMDLVSEFVFSGFSALQALSCEPCRPFDRLRSGLSLGEGAAAILLMDGARARREERPILGAIAGWGGANDATHITAPARDGSGLVLACCQALERGGITPAAVSAVSAHGTGTVYNDLMELTAFRTVFGERAVPLQSVKGAIGHTLGAAGGIEVVLGLKSLATGTLPPTVGFSDPEEGADGRVTPEPLPVTGPYLLTTNSGFGGVNAALVLKGGES